MNDTNKKQQKLDNFHVFPILLFNTYLHELITTDIFIHLNCFSLSTYIVWSLNWKKIKAEGKKYQISNVFYFLLFHFVVGEKIRKAHKGTERNKKEVVVLISICGDIRKWACGWRSGKNQFSILFLWQEFLLILNFLQFLKRFDGSWSQNWLKMGFWWPNLTWQRYFSHFYTACVIWQVTVKLKVDKNTSKFLKSSNSLYPRCI